MASIDRNDELNINSFAIGITDREDLIDVRQPGKTLGQNIVAALKKITVGLTEWEYKILAAVSSTNSILCKILPIIELKGEAGSGKSQLLIAIGEISGNALISGQSTGASLKNYINKIRWADPDTKSVEKPCLLLIDNLNEESFKKEEYLSSFLNGYNRKTDRTFISNGKGENIEFKTFTLKVYTTIWDTPSTELKRRTVSIQTRKTKSLEGVLDVDDIDWHSLKADCNLFWKCSENWERYVSIRSALSKAVKPEGTSKEQWTLLRDLLATGILVGAWDDVKDCVQTTGEWLIKSQKARLNLLEAVILKCLENEIGFNRPMWTTLAQTVQIHVAPKAVKSAIDTAVADGLIDKPKLPAVQQALKKLGFAPGKKDEIWGYKFKGNETENENR